MKYTLLVNRCSKSSIETVKQRCPKAIIVNFGEVFPFQTSGVFHIETSHLLAKQMTGFYMKRNTGLLWVNAIVTKKLVCPKPKEVQLFLDGGPYDIETSPLI